MGGLSHSCDDTVDHFLGNSSYEFSSLCCVVTYLVLVIGVAIGNGVHGVCCISLRIPCR